MRKPARVKTPQYVYNGLGSMALPVGPIWLHVHVHFGQTQVTLWSHYGYERVVSADSISVSASFTVALGFTVGSASPVSARSHSSHTQVTLRSHSGHTQVTLRSHSGHTQVTLRSHSVWWVVRYITQTLCSSTVF